MVTCASEQGRVGWCDSMPFDPKKVCDQLHEAQIHFWEELYRTAKSRENRNIVVASGQGAHRRSLLSDTSLVGPLRELTLKVQFHSRLSHQKSSNKS